MLIVGAGGLAKEVLELVLESRNPNNIFFYDDVNYSEKSLLYERYPILTSIDSVNQQFDKITKEFCIGVGGVQNRVNLYNRFIAQKGKATPIISRRSIIASTDVNIESGTIVFPNVTISNSTKIGICGLLYYNVVITHDVVIGDFVEISPGAVLLGGVEIGSYTHIGSNATILPKIKIGKNVIIGAGSVVTKDVPDFSLVVGVPGKVIKKNKPVIVTQ